MKFNRKWMEHHGMLVRLVLIGFVLTMVLFTALKRCTEVGKSAAKEVYVPSNDEGFVKKANLLLSHLVQQGNDEHSDIHPHSITTLQERYPALQFALPYDEDAVEGARATDIRLVGIKADLIQDEDDKNFYYNSNLPKLLEQQRENLSERVFRISFSAVDSLVIGKIEVMAHLFKVALSKDPWVGTVSCADNALFPEAEHCFLTWGKSVVPIRMVPDSSRALQGGHEQVVRLDENSHTLTMQEGQPIDYYRLFSNDEEGRTTLCVTLPSATGRRVYLDYLTGGRLRVRCVGCWCQPYCESGALKTVPPTSAASQGKVVPLNHQLKLIVSAQQQSETLGELVVSRRNPMLTLSSLIRSSKGRSRYTIPSVLTDRFTQQIVQGLSGALRNSVYKDSIHLSIDPMLSMVMERELESYAHELMGNREKFYDDDQWELSLTVMDMATGMVIAAPYYRSADREVDEALAISRKNPALTHRYIGSTFKPLVALAAVLTRPELARLSTVGDYRITRPGDGKKVKAKAMFYGHETSAWSAKGSAAGFWNGCESMRKFFTISDDVYPVALVARALNYGQPSGSPFSFRNHEVHLDNNNAFTWSGSRFIHTLDHLYSIPGPKDYETHDSLQMEYYTWDNLRLNPADRFCLDNVSPEPTLFDYDKFAYPGATLYNELSTWVLGQGTNDWNSLKLAEAWTRMLTKRKVKASLLRIDGQPQMEDLATGYDNQAWNAVLQALREAQSSRDKRLLWPMDDAVRHLNAQEHINDTLLLFSKTGTPDNYTRTEWMSVKGGPRWLDIGLYCMALMPSSAYRSVRANQGGRGLMCVIRVTRIVNGKHKRVTKNGSENNDNGIQSTDARNFFSGNENRLRRFYLLTKSYLE